MDRPSLLAVAVDTGRIEALPLDSDAIEAGDPSRLAVVDLALSEDMTGVVWILVCRRVWLDDSAEGQPLVLE